MIGSLKEFQSKGGEILLLDTGSTDNTVKVAEDLGVKVIGVKDKFKITIDKELADEINKKFIVDGEMPVVKEGESLFDFASARNYIADFANNDMIATPDCDEIYTKLDLDKVQELIKAGVEQLEYNFVFSHDEQGNPVIKFRHCKFYNRKKLSWKGIIHETLVGTAQCMFVDESVIKLEHYQNVETNRTGYLKGLAIDCFKNPDNDRNSHYFAREMMYNHRFKSAIKEFERHIAMNKWQTEVSQSMLYMGDCYKYLGNIDEMFKYYIKSINVEARREPLMRLAEYYFSKGLYKQVILYCEAALTILQLPFYSNHQPYYENLPHELLYIAYWWEGNKTKSEEHHKIALSYCPTNPKYIEDAKFYKELPIVSFVIPTLGREEGLKRCIDSIKKLDYPQDKIEIIVKQDSFENRIGVPKLLWEGAMESNGQWLVFAANDTEFTPSSLREALDIGQDGFVAFNTGEVLPDEGNICEHFMIRSDVVAEIGEIFDTEFFHVGVDNLLWAKMKKLGRAKRADKAIVNHKHFSRGGTMDKTYTLGWSNIESDRALLKKKLQELAN